MTFSLAYVIALVLVIVPCTRLNIVNKSILLNTSLLLHSTARKLSDVDLGSFDNFLTLVHPRRLKYCIVYVPESDKCELCGLLMYQLMRMSRA